MTDKELLELAAKAAGIELKWMTQLGNGVKPNEDFISNWHPLTDDGDALRLAVKLGFDIDIWLRKGITIVDCVTVVENENHGNDAYAATRRAIVRAAAEIGKTL